MNPKNKTTTLLFNPLKSFSVSCNVKGGKAIGTFIASLVVAEILSKLCLVLVVPHAGINPATAAAATASPLAAISPVLQPVEPTADLSAAGAQFVDLLVKQDFAGAVGRFDPIMKAALPEPQLREVWQTLGQQAGPFARRLRTRVEGQGGMTWCWSPATLAMPTWTQKWFSMRTGGSRAFFCAEPA
jgi:hypothetical protein